MSRSMLLQLARDSIQEVLQAKNSIDKEVLLHEHPLLGEVLPTKINIYIDDELHSSFTSTELPLLEAIVIGAKKAAFEVNEPLLFSKYMECEIEIKITTQEGVISHRDNSLRKES